jgi:hypothetical protein
MFSSTCSWHQQVHSNVSTQEEIGDGKERKFIRQKQESAFFFSELLRSGWGEAGKKDLSLHKLDPTSCQQCKSCFTSMI